MVIAQPGVSLALSYNPHGPRVDALELELEEAPCEPGIPPIPGISMALVLVIVLVVAGPPVRLAAVEVASALAAAVPTVRLIVSGVSVL